MTKQTHASSQSCFRSCFRTLAVIVVSGLSAELSTLIVVTCMPSDSYRGAVQVFVLVSPVVYVMSVESWELTLCRCCFSLFVCVCL